MPKCKYPECRKHANFGMKNGKILFCKTHKQEEMINLSRLRQTCLECDTVPNYNYPEKKGGIYCTKHKEEGMVNVNSKTCLECNKQPAYNYKGEKRGLYCSTHKKEGMIDVKCKRCLECDKQPTYNYKGEKIGVYCVAHKKEGMVDIRHKTCLECDTRPSYNYKGEKIGMYCVVHKKEGMVNTVSKPCVECDKQPSYNYKGIKGGLYCCEHKKEGMVDVMNKACLECDIRACYNYEGKRQGIYCDKHKKEDMVNVKDKHCKTPMCGTVVRNKYRGYCVRCFMYKYPDEPIVRNYKTKERAVSMFLDTSIDLPSGIMWTTDKRIVGGCSKRRPDKMINQATHAVIVEIDENQHMPYDCSCENKRLMELSADLKHKPIVFIRFNPDGYTSGTTRVPSCWTINKNGVLEMSKRQTTMWKKRLAILKETVEYWIKTPTDKTVEIIQLFYDM